MPHFAASLAAGKDQRGLALACALALDRGHDRLERLVLGVDHHGRAPQAIPLLELLLCALHGLAALALLHGAVTVRGADHVACRV